MEVSVNERSVSTSATEESTLMSLLDELRGSGEIPADHVVVGLRVGDRRWGSAEFDLQLDAPLQGVDRIHIDTEDLHGYGRRILEDAAGMLDVMCEAAVEIARQFRAGDPHEGSANLFNLLDSLQRFLFCLSRVKQICAPEGGEAPQPGPAGPALSAALDLALACQEAQDWDGLADRLESDLVPAMRGFEAVLAELRDRI